MRPETYHRIEMANVCLPDPETWESQVGLLVLSLNMQQQRQESREVLQIYNCERRTHNPQRCLENLVRSRPGALSFSNPFFELCHGVYNAGQRTRREEGRNLVQLSHDLSLLLFADPVASLLPQEREFLNTLVAQYAHWLSSPFEFIRALESRPQWMERLNYYPASENNDFNHPFQCSNSADFESDTVQIRSISLPIFFLRNQQVYRDFLKWDLEAGLQIAQAFFHPDDFMRLVHPGNGQPDMSFYITGPFTNVELGQISSNSAGQPEAALAQCGLNTQNAGGLSDGSHNRIWIRAYAGSSTFVQSTTELNLLTGTEQAIDPSRYAATSVTWDTLFHELGHAIAYNFLRNTPAWQNIQTFYNWTHEQIRAHPNQSELIPNYFSHIVRAGNQVTLLPPRDYGNTDVDQFFAELVEEYFKTESEGRGPNNPYFRARRRILQSFFGPRLNLDAFTPQNINAAFLAEGLTIRVQGETPRPAPSAPARVTPSPRQVVRPPAARAAPVQTSATPQSFDTSGFEFRAYYSRDQYGRSGGGIAANIASRRTGGVNWGVGLTLTGFEESSGRPSGYFAFEGGLRTPPGPVENPFFHLEGFFRIGAFLGPDPFLLGLGARGVLNPFSSRFQVFVGGLLAFQGSNFWADWQVGLGGHFY